MHLYEGREDQFEFQRIYGMGDLTYRNAKKIYSDFPLTRVYAPVGSKKELLPYLVRRILENGANSSFVNKYIDTLDESLLVELEKFLNFEDEIILNYYNKGIAEKKIDKNRVSKIFKNFKL